MKRRFVSSAENCLSCFSVDVVFANRRCSVAGSGIHYHQRLEKPMGQNATHGILQAIYGHDACLRRHWYLQCFLLLRRFRPYGCIWWKISITWYDGISVLSRQELHSSAILDILVTISSANDNNNDNPTSLPKAQCLIHIADSKNMWKNTKCILKVFHSCC